MPAARKSPSLKLISWNVNGVRAALKNGLMDFLAAQDADIICLQEIKATADQAEEQLWPATYRRHWYSAEKKGYSGVAVLTRPEPLSVTTGMNLPAHDAEGRVLNVEYEDFILVNVYTPNSQRRLARLPYRTQQWEPAFLAHLKKLEKRKPVIVCGDLNVAHKEIDIARPKDNVQNAGFTPQERACMDQVIAAGFVDTFREFESGPGHYTWWSYMNNARARNIGWRIDYFLISAALRPRLGSAFILPEVTGSDHCPVGITIKG